MPSFLAALPDTEALAPESNNRVVCLHQACGSRSPPQAWCRQGRGAGMGVLAGNHP